MHELTKAIPDANVLLELRPEELGPKLALLLKRRFGSTHFHPGNLVLEVWQSGPGQQTVYPGDKRAAIDQALMETFAWLEQQGLVVPASGSNGQHGWRNLSRRAQQYEREDEFSQQTPDGTLPNPKAAHSDTGQFDGLISGLVDGTETDRADILHQIQTSTSMDRSALSARLRSEIQNRFSPQNQKDFGSAARNPSLMSSVRSWMLSCLIWCDFQDEENRNLMLRHISTEEPDRHVRFWTLAGLFQRTAPLKIIGVEQALSDPAPEVALLAQATSPELDRKIIPELRSRLRSDNFDDAWPVLRVLRVVPIIDLVPDVCLLLDRPSGEAPFVYDALYALIHPEMAAAAKVILLERPGIKAVVEKVVREAQSSNPNAMRNFTGLLAAFDPGAVESVLAEAALGPESRETALALSQELKRRRNIEEPGAVLMAGYAPDVIDISKDPLDIQEDVRTLAAVMLAKDAPPPLAIGLFGDWGSGKSYFMKSMISTAKKMADKAGKNPSSKFCAHIVSVEFNAWHYADTNLWASLVNHILEELVAYVTPQPTSLQQEEATRKDLNKAKEVVAAAEAEKSQAEEQIKDRQLKLSELENKRKEKEVKLRELRAADLDKLLSNERAAINQTLEEMGLPATLGALSDLSGAVSEAQSLWGRMTAFCMAVTSGRNRFLLIGGIVLVVVVGPAVAYFSTEIFPGTDQFARISAWLAQAGAIAVSAAGLLRGALRGVNANFEKLEAAKSKVDALIAQKRQTPSSEESKLEREIASFKVQESEAALRIQAAAARVLELEERIAALQQGRSLVQFLAERSRSDDYRKHLGLISTIRRDFEALVSRLATGQGISANPSRPVDRIILYIDDLDRCPAREVMQVLQAVHLLLAFPLFVVVVGVDPRWLLRSLRRTYSVFRGGKTRAIAGSERVTDDWETTPQNYLEKIFQVPFSLRRMSPDGYARLATSLLNPVKDASTKTPPPAGGKPGSPHLEGTGLKKIEAPEHEPVNSFEIVEEALTIRSWEAKFAGRLFGIMETPRGVKRFSNTYRMLKAPVQRDKLATFEGTETIPGDFQVPMLLLAILIGAPAGAAEIFLALSNEARIGNDPAQLFADPQRSGVPDVARLAGPIRKIVDDKNFPKTPKVYREWLPRVARFSFETGRFAPEFEDSRR